MAISGPMGADINAPGYGRQGRALPQLSRYVLRQLLGPVAVLSLLLTCIILLVESLRLLDLVINRGQSILTFLYLTVLELPSLFLIILPIAFFVGTIFTLSRLNGDSELVVMASAGYSQRQLARPVFITAGLVMALTWLCALWLSPLCQRALNDELGDIRADVAGALINEGEFNDNIPGLTIFIRQLDSDGQIKGVLVHDSRDAKHALTYLAQKGVLAQTPSGARLLLSDVTVEQSSAGGSRLTVATFQTFPINLDQFAGAARPVLRKTDERYLGELLNPAEAHITAKIKAAYLAEAHDRLSQPLYCLAFAMISLAAILRGRRQRGALALRLSMAALAAGGLRIAGYGLKGVAAGSPALDPLFYVIPLLGAGLALLVLMGYSPRAILARRTKRNAAA